MSEAQIEQRGHDGEIEQRGVRLALHTVATGLERGPEGIRRLELHDPS